VADPRDPSATTPIDEATLDTVEDAVGAALRAGDESGLRILGYGEITLVVAGAPDIAPAAEGAPREAGAQAQLERTVQAALAHLPASKAAALAAEACDVPRAEAYALAVRLAALRR
jgi:hypothetical protein